MTTQSEQTLENNLIAQLHEMKYERVAIADEVALVANLKTQLEKHNGVTLSDKEFSKVLSYLSKGNVFDRAKTLRDKMHLVRDDGTSAYIEFINQKKWCQNQFQVTNQVTIDGAYKNRYDVTILVNGLPLVQIELKRRGLELKEAFNQVNRYRKHSYAAGYGLYQYVQIFVISNGVNTKYYSNTVGYDNDKKASFKFTSYWADKDNLKITKLEDFAKVFLEKCHIAKMIAKYTVLQTNKTLVVLRPYQYYAVEEIVDRVSSGNKNGYIWHTTGSGKTLTSFKASQLLVDNPDVYKVVFVVDRNDLDNQTIREFNNFKKDSVDATDNTHSLVKQFGEPDTKLIVTTIQKLNNAVTHERHALKMVTHRDKKIVFIFDECHRSQFGETHKKITEYFTNRQLFGFTGTPIFAENASGNAMGKRTTKELFGECLHKYVITDAISDENVLKFAVEYVGKYRRKDSANEIDVDVEAIDTKELMESPQRIEKITDYIIANHDRKTHSRDFTAIFALSSIDVLTKYYDIFRAKKQSGDHNLKIATIFSYGTNEEDKNADSMLDDDPQLDLFSQINQHSRDKLESYIADYNEMFGTSYSTKDSQSFYNYYRNIADRLKAREIDILLVVNMFLTGFDSPTLNTMYVDKNLRYHGLLQAYSRTNRILNETKSQGNIVVFRNLKKATDDALRLFADKNAQEVIFMEPYEDYAAKFDEMVAQLYAQTPTPESVDNLVGEEAQLEFVKTFRELMRLKNILVSFADFDFSHVSIGEQTFNDFKSKYLDIYDKVRGDHEKEKVSILEDVDFELELIRRDEVNVDYIIRLLAQLVGADEAKTAKLMQNIMDTMSTDATLRSKRELIEKFINSTIPNISNAEDVETEFNNFWDQEKLEAFQEMCSEEGLMNDKLQALIDRYLYSGRKPRKEDFAKALEKQPGILQRESIIKRVTSKFNGFIETFIEGV
ncbi:deoxyribonuclease HsdR [Candidatus Saccharibacteria bacterium RIFCSPHIGHO2_12_FULL_41_12]|nr:MAG: deoxyribonuclease HsdR [Candidatus Saccharibacteria bacterium RIFCSPHIGHO2_12_FULL_41_12]